jgi:hypothetical protein
MRESSLDVCTGDMCAARHAAASVAWAVLAPSGAKPALIAELALGGPVFWPQRNLLPYGA